MRRLIVWGTLIVMLASVFVVAKNQPAVQDPVLAKPKLAVAIAPDALQYLAKHQNQGKVKVWVFFTDKGIVTKSQFGAAALAAHQGLTARAIARRAKHGITEPQFVDIPVNQHYVDVVATAAGAKLRQVSKWLNAASFEVDQTKLPVISKYPFVEKVQPVMLYKKDGTLPIDGKTAPQKSGLDAQGLLYGSSQAQLAQISVPQCHDSGYAGQGMIISMFDSGFRTSHNSFSHIRNEDRLIAKYDFIFNDTVVDNQAIDDPSAWSHGTSTWSTCGGENAGIHYGPAFKASFILCKTEDVRSETPIEEDNWVRAVEFVDSIGTDIISSSLGYTDWYTTSDYNGRTCTTTLAALQAARFGILVCNSIGNSGPGPTTMGAPADADSIISVGAVTSSGSLSYFSSMGPTADGRMKPEVCALGSSDYVASSTSDAAYTYSSGTSFSCPLTAGAAAVIWGAHPSWTNMQVRQAMMMTASRASNPDNSFGWGIVNAWAAIHYFTPPPVYVHGDANHDGTVDISDVVRLVGYIFAGGAAPNPQASGDADCSGAVDISDAVYLINYIFGNGPAPC
jgi:serine protease AprX